MNLHIKYKRYIINKNNLIQNNKVKRSDNISVHLFKLFDRYTCQAVTLMSIFNMNCLSCSIQEVSTECYGGLHEDLTEMVTLCSYDVPNIILASQRRLTIEKSQWR